MLIEDSNNTQNLRLNKDSDKTLIATGQHEFAPNEIEHSESGQFGANLANKESKQSIERTLLPNDSFGTPAVQSFDKRKPFEVQDNEKSEEVS